MKRKNFYFLFVLSAFLFVSFFGLASPPNGYCVKLYEDNYDRIMSSDLPNREGLKVGNVLLHAALKTGVDFESNIFLANTAEKYDTVYAVSPSVGIEVPMQDNRLSVEYENSMYFFNRSKEQEHIDHKVRGLLSINLTDFKILLDDTYRRFTDRTGTSEIGTTGIRTREERNDFELSTGAQFDKLAFKVSYYNKLRNFLGKNQSLFGIMNYDDKNSMSNIGNIEVDYDILPKTTLLLDTSVGRINYFSELVPDSYFIEVMPGFKSDWTSKLSIDFRIGTRYQEYDDSSFMEDDSFFGVVGRGSAQYKLTDNDVIGLSLERTVLESIYQDINYYNANKIAIDYAHKFNDKLTGDIYYAWQLNRYPKASTEETTARRHDVIYRSGILFRYEPQNWMAFEAGYEARQRDSNFGSLDYLDHVGSLQVVVGF